MHKLDLNDVTFLIPVRIDSSARYKNLLLVIKYLTYYTSTHIIVLEADDSSKISSHLLPEQVEYYFVQDGCSKFHRTHYINQMAEKVQTPYLSIYDADVILSLIQLENTARFLREGYAYVLPYDGSLVMTKEEEKFLFLSSMNTDVFKKTILMEHVCGGAIFLNRLNFIEAGMSNEYITSWGPDDVEQKKRMEILGYSMTTVKGILFHLEHPRKENSSYETTEERILLTEEYVKIASMSREALADYVRSWPWIKPYLQVNPEKAFLYRALIEKLDRLVDEAGSDWNLHTGKTGIALAYLCLSDYVEREKCRDKACNLLREVCREVPARLCGEKILVAWAFVFMRRYFQLPDEFALMQRQVDTALFRTLMSQKIKDLSFAQGALLNLLYFTDLLYFADYNVCHHHPVFYKEQLVFITDEIYRLLTESSDSLIISNKSTNEELRETGQILLAIYRILSWGINRWKVLNLYTRLKSCLWNYMKSRKSYGCADGWILYALYRIERAENNSIGLDQAMKYCEAYLLQCDFMQADEQIRWIRRYFAKELNIRNRDIDRITSETVFSVLENLPLSNGWMRGWGIF